MQELRKHTVFIFILIFVSNFAFTQKKSNKSEIRKIKGTWIYSHSFNSDTSLVLKSISNNTNSGKLCREYTFLKDSLPDTNYVNLYRGLVCKIPNDSYFSTYFPVAFDFSTHEFKERREVILYYDKKLSQKFHWFQINSIHKKLMYIVDERYYEQDQETFIDFTHVYKRVRKH